MLKWLRRAVLGQNPASKSYSYEEARRALESHDLEARKELARTPGSWPEILYFLAKDGSPVIRQLVAGNPSTPQHANKILAEDGEADVRCELARKIGRIVPGLRQDETTTIRDLAIEVMERLAKDSLPRVRAILSEEIKRAENVPQHIVKQLARDLELIVCAPVLEYSPLLGDEDLIEIIAGARVEGSLSAIAKRQSVSEDVSDALVASVDVSAIAALLANPNAQIREEALDRVIAHAADVEAWHRPMVMRADLSLRAVRRIAGFVGASLLHILQQQSCLDDETVSLLNKRVRERLENERVSEEGLSLDEQARQAVEVAVSHNKLNEAFVSGAIERGERRVIAHCLSRLSKLPVALVDRIMLSQSGKAIASLVWTCGLSMRLAVHLQTTIARLPGHKIILAKDGVAFPLSVEEMRWHLSYFGQSN